MANPAGSFIWYELMTPDPAGSKRFYDAVVAGWTIEDTCCMDRLGNRTQPTLWLSFKQCGRTSGVQAQACGSRHEWQWKFRSRDADPSVSAAHPRSLV